MTPTDIAGWVAAAPVLLVLFALICVITAALEQTATWERIVDRVADRIAR